MKAWLPLLIPALVFMASVFVHLFIMRFLQGLTIVQTLLLQFAIGTGCWILVLLFAFFGARDFLGWSELGYGYFLWLMLWYCYFHFINIGVASVRVRILTELVHVQSNQMPEAQLLERYGSQHILAARLERLLKSEEIELRNGLYFMKKRRLYWIGVIFRLMKRLLNQPNSPTALS